MLGNIINRRQEGFSLVELMIALAVFGLLMALALPAYQAFIQNTRIRTTAESILNGLQLARAEAVKRNASVQFVLGANSDWSVGCLPPVVADNDGDGEPDCPAILQSRPTSDGASSSILVTPIPAGKTQVVFSNLGVVSSTVNTFTQVNIDVSTSVLPSTESRDLSIVIGTGGNARMCDPNVSALDDNRKC